MNVFPNRFLNKVVLITGAGSGIGRGIALRFAREGASLAVVDIKQDLASNVASEIRSIGSKVLPITADATRSDDVTKSVAQVYDHFGSVDILVNNVGYNMGKPIMQSEESDWDFLTDINAKAAFLWSKAVAKRMIDERKRGIIVNTASESARQPDPFSGLYIPAKHAVAGLSKTLAVELAPYGIRVNAVNPGVVDTKLMADVTKKIAAMNNTTVEESYKRMISEIPLGRLATPDDVAGTVTFLASDDASFITGQTVIVNGGELIV